MYTIRLLEGAARRNSSTGSGGGAVGGLVGGRSPLGQAGMDRDTLLGSAAVLTDKTKEHIIKKKVFRRAIGTQSVSLSSRTDVRTDKLICRKSLRA